MRIRLSEEPLKKKVKNKKIVQEKPTAVVVKVIVSVNVIFRTTV